MSASLFAPPLLQDYDMVALEQTCTEQGESQISFTVEIEHQHITQRIMVGLLDESRERGVAITIHPATGEVGDLSNGSGVIGYVSLSPLIPGQRTKVDIVIYKYGRNCVCNVRVLGETFLYPAFVLPENSRLTGLIGSHALSGHTVTCHASRIDVAQAPHRAVA
ncbi:MAG TPA: hypothetical protein P5016_18225 [Verrucomicrobiales bacterium]|nr:hypothetical protein [Verrucomicrobiae bacterium]MCP5553215.1 hypothetical protein [Akkermansiaceae bacterium]HRX56460.1 hypothetical protein [Verrucomicrobiales bacterium]